MADDTPDLDAIDAIDAIEKRHRRSDTDPAFCDYCDQAWPCDADFAVRQVRELRDTLTTQVQRGIDAERKIRELEAVLWGRRTPDAERRDGFSFTDIDSYARNMGLR